MRKDLKNKVFDHFFTGINYWGSKDAIHMWAKYDETSVENDLRLLREAGVTMLRVFPTWPDFQPLTAFYAPGGVYEYGMNGKPFPDTEAGQAGVSDEMCQHFEHFCGLAEQYGMKLIVGVLTGHMSFANLMPPALVNLNLVSDAVAIKWELKFIRYFVRRMKKQPAIIGWDLGNEVNALQNHNTQEEFDVWSGMLADAIKACDPDRPVITGVGRFKITNGAPNLKELSEICDWNTVHAYNIFETASDPVNSMKPVMDHVFRCRLSEDIGRMPTFLQEFGATGYTNCSLESEAEFYRASVLSILSHGFYGTMYWCAFDQGHLTFPPYNWNNIGSNYGFFDKELKIKPVANENIRLQELIRLSHGKLTDYERSCTIIVPREEWLDQKDAMRAAYMLAERVGLDTEFSYAIDPIPDAQIYIMPCQEFNKSITNTRLTELLGKVKEGAVLYLSMGAALFRNLNELAGVILDERINMPTAKTMYYGEAELPVNVTVQYHIKANGCEVLAKDEKGEPIFVKNPYGKGYIYVLFAPMEQYLADKEGAFYKENTPDYESIYRLLKSHVQEDKIAVCPSKFICMTEHPAENEDRYLFAINYSSRVQEAELHITGDYELIPVWGQSLENRKICLAPCDGILIHAKCKR